MAQYTFAKPASDSGGPSAVELSSGEVNGLFNTLTGAERASGATKYRKLYISSDNGGTVYVWLNKGDYSTAIFKSLSSAETVGDLPNGENYFGPATITAVTDASNITVEDEGIFSLFRVGDYVGYDDVPTQIASVTPGAGTIDLSFTTPLNKTPAVGEEISSALPLSLTANVEQPIWRVNSYPTGASRVAAYNTVTLYLGT